VIFSKKIVRPVSESYEKQKQFISIAGHEIKTPITIIDADSELLSMEVGDENEWLQDIRTQTKRMAMLTNDMLSLSRMDENRQQFTMIDFPISDIVEETITSFQTLARSKGRNIQADITPMLSYKGDESSIRQVVGILLDNAIKYTKPDENGNYPDIEVKLEKKNRVILLTVTNHSEPVTQEQLRHFFDRFYRTEQSDKSEQGGYGLGLSIAKSIVEKHKGRITATTPNSDTVQITVTLIFH
jgi:signal transduction histidine kinase